MIELSTICLAQESAFYRALGNVAAFFAVLQGAVWLYELWQKKRGRRDDDERDEHRSGGSEPPSGSRIVVFVNDEMWCPIPYSVIRDAGERDHVPERPGVFLLPERLVGQRVSIWDELADRNMKNDILRRNLDGLYRIVVAGPDKSNEG